ncbi:MAG: co-chaperone GroES [Oscillospiraceae bacterium]|nr:co-chaperone GroES [Oscillospiraceae bacterium]
MLRPLGERLIVKPKEKETTTASGIIIPDTSKEKPVTGEVVAVGSGEVIDGKRVPLDVKVGDTVMYSKYAGNEIKYEGVEYLILKQSEVLVIVE